MKYRKTFVRVLAAAAVASTVLSVPACKNYDDDIEELRQRVDALEVVADAFDALSEAGCMIEQIVPIPGGQGYRIFFTGDREPIEILHGMAGVTPRIEVRPDASGTGCTVWYNVTAGYPEEGWVDTGVNIRGTDAVPPQIRVHEGTGGELTVQYNVTAGYPEEGWVDTGVDLRQPESENPIASVVENGDGTVTFYLNAFGMPSYTFARFSTAQHIEIMTAGPVEFTGSEEIAVVFRVNPSGAFVPTGANTAIARWSIDEIESIPAESRAGYVNPSEVFTLRSVWPDGYPDAQKPGQYVATIACNHLKHDPSVGAYRVALVLNNDVSGENPDGALISSGAIELRVALPEEETLASGTVGETDNIAWRLTSDGTLTFSGAGAMPDWGYYPAAPWNTGTYKTLIARVQVGEGITRVGNSSFSGCTQLEEVTLPASLEQIGESAFANSPELVRVTLPEGVTELGAYAFSGCTGLTSVGLPAGLKSIGSQTFSNSGLVSVTIPDGVESIGMTAFSNCAALAEVTIGTRLAKLPEYGFENCKALVSVRIPGNVTTVGNYAFSGCTALAEVILEEGVESIGSSAFRYCPFTEIALPASLRSLSGSVFEYCTQLIAVEIPDGVTNLGTNVFHGCTGLSTLTVGRGVKTLPYGFTANCDALVSVTLRTDALVINTEESGNFMTNTGDTLYVPAAWVETYRAEDAWATAFSTIEAIPEE